MGAVTSKNTGISLRGRLQLAGFAQGRDPRSGPDQGSGSRTASSPGGPCDGATTFTRAGEAR